MRKPKLFISGGSGLLALNWAASMSPHWQVELGLHDRNLAPDFATATFVDLENKDQFARYLANFEPDLVVHAAGMTNVEACEQAPDLAHHVNVEIAAQVAKVCAKNGVNLVSISTDHLFGGDPQMADELEAVEPVNVYGRSKAAGEKAVLDANPDALVLRTNFYGWGPSYRRSFSDFILDNLRAGAPISLFSDVFFTPILADTLAKAAHRLVAQKATGIFNLVGNERVSKYAFGRRLANKFGLDVELIGEGKLAERRDLVKRPLEMSLCNKKATELTGFDLGDLDGPFEVLATQLSDPSIKALKLL